MRLLHLGKRALVALGTAVVLLAATQPAVAEPGETIPDDGSRPFSGEEDDYDLGDVPIANPEAEEGPLTAEIDRAQIVLAQLNEDVTGAADELEVRQQRQEATWESWQEKLEALEASQESFDLVAADAFRDSDSNDLTDFAGTNGSESDLAAETSQLNQAQNSESLARATFDAAEASAERSEARWEMAVEARDDQEEELEELIEENLELLEELEQERDDVAGEHSGDFSTEIDGMQAAPEAVQAVEFSLAQLGKPYEWGATGPNTFDCSGLTQMAYQHAGVDLPRVAADQYYATRDKPVAVENLLPGDLLFWGDVPGDWRSVYHMGIYLGDGQMVQAPRTGDVVKISNIWFGNYFGAHRVVDAVDGDGDPIQPPPGDEPTDEPTSDPTSSPSPTETSSPTESPTESPTSSPTETPTSSPTETPTETPTSSPTATPTQSPTSSPSPTETPSPSGSESESPSDEPSGSESSSSPTPSRTPSEEESSEE